MHFCPCQLGHHSQLHDSRVHFHCSGSRNTLCRTLIKFGRDNQINVVLAASWAIDHAPPYSLSLLDPHTYTLEVSVCSLDDTCFTSSLCLFQNHGQQVESRSCIEIPRIWNDLCQSSSDMKYVLFVMLKLLKPQELWLHFILVD